jgi:hypothetical protein
VRIRGFRRVLLVVVVSGPFVFVQLASAALWIHAKSTTVKAGSSIVLEGVVEGVPIYLVPVRTITKFTPPCSGCAPYTPRPPQQPLILLGRGPNNGRKSLFVLTVPRVVAAGAYRVALYCASCYKGPGGSLILDTRSLIVTRS